MDLMVRSSKVYIENDISRLNEVLATLKLRKKLFIITDENLYRLYKDMLSNALNYDLEFIVLPSGEKSKSIDNVLMIAKRLLEVNIKRNDTIVGFGGGVISDITGFVASILYRGINHVIIPTSLLAMVDASLGGKTGVDFYNRKNILGAFYEPKLIFIATEFLNTLPEAELKSGFGEVFKYAFIKPSLQDKLFNGKLALIISDCIAIKKKFIEEDFYDQGPRMQLNLGHTFGHIIEIKYGLSHGIAVISGMKMIFKLEEDLGLIDDSYLKKLNSLLEKYKITAPDYDYRVYLADIFNDKKNLKGVLSLVFVDSNGTYLFSNTKEELYAKISSR